MSLSTTSSEAAALPPVVPSAASWIDVLEFVASITSSLAWPVVVLVIALAFKKPIINALQNLKSFKWGDKEAVFGQELKELAEKANAIDVADEHTASLNNPRLVQLIDMAAVSPTGAVIEAWKDVVNIANELVLHSNISTQTSKIGSPIQLVRLVQQHKLLPRAEAETFDELRNLRNRAAHGAANGITVDQARQYVRIADRLVDTIRTQVADAPY